MRRLQADGAARLVHGNRGQQPVNRVDDDVRARVVDKALTTHAGFNPVHLAETLAEEDPAVDAGAAAPASQRGAGGELLRRADAVPAVLRDMLVGRSEGNPFIAEELVRMLLEDGIIEHALPSPRPGTSEPIGWAKCASGPALSVSCRRAWIAWNRWNARCSSERR